jgi:hypothetical protein
MEDRKMKRLFCYLIIYVCLATALSGCSDIRAKFIRKPKEDTSPRRYIPVREYDIRPSMDLYSKRYIFWNNWHKEFMDLVRNPRMTNQKKITVAIEQEISNLYDMKRMLVDEKGDELQLAIDGVQKIEDDIKKQTLTSGNRVRIIRTMDLLGKEIRDKFFPRKVIGEIRDEFRRE